MNKAGLGGAILCFAAASPLTGPGGDDFETLVQPLLERHCQGCHGARVHAAKLDLSVFVDETSARAAPEVWHSIRERLADGSMPPGESAHLAGDERLALLGWIDDHLPGDEPLGSPGRTVLRRLNHREYRNTIRDLFGVDFPADELFPADGAGHGFDTCGEALSMPDAMFEKYLDAAEEIAARAIVDEEPGEPPRTRRGPASFTGDGGDRGDEWSLHSQGAVGHDHDFPRDGEYFVRVGAWAQQAGPELARLALGVDAGPAEEQEVEGTRAEPSTHERRMRLTRGRHRVEARFVNDFYVPAEGDRKAQDRNLYVVWLEVVGPLDPPPIGDFQRELFTRFGEGLGEQRLERIALHLARRAWRRPVTDEERERLVDLASGERSLEARVRIALTAILVSPHFLFRPELEPGRLEDGAESRPLDGYELATRLTYFLWSSAPDEPLLAAAERGALEEDEGLRAETLRLLADPRARALAEGFAAQWLQVRSLDRADVDTELFPAFDEELRSSMREETLCFFEHLLRENRSVWELIDADYTFVDERLARHYGIEGVRGDDPRRVSLEGLPRRGVLAHASVLTLTSNPNRTSPVKRGKWILETLLAAPPPPPPPGVVALDDSPEAMSAASNRERLEEHRRDPACAVCHEKMDPLGFALENYDAVGAWRQRDGAFPIDASGTLPDGRSFDGPRELIDVLRQEDAFLRGLVEKLFVYGLGRGLTEEDEVTVDAVLAKLDPERPTLRAMIEGVVLSSAFRRLPPAPTTR